MIAVDHRPPLQEIGAKYPDWLTANRASLPAEELARYEKQQVIIGKICTLYEQPTPDMGALVVLLQEVGVQCDTHTALVVQTMLCLHTITSYPWTSKRQSILHYLCKIALYSCAPLLNATSHNPRATCMHPTPSVATFVPPQMQQCGQPPPDIVTELAPGLEFDPQGLPVLPGLGGEGDLPPELLKDLEKCCIQ